LSQNTNDRNRDRAWEALIARYPGRRTASASARRGEPGSREPASPDWDSVVRATRRQLEATIRVGGLAPTKSARIQQVLREVKAARGAYAPDFLVTASIAEGEAYLRRFKGVGLKTIRCVLLFSCRKPVIPVDTHIFRVGKRLGLFPAKASPDRAHALLQAVTPASEVYPFHVNLIAHGRKVCKAARPLCDVCPVTDLCAFYEAASRKRRAGRRVVHRREGKRG